MEFLPSERNIFLPFFFYLVLFHLISPRISLERHREIVLPRSIARNRLVVGFLQVRARVRQYWLAFPSLAQTIIAAGNHYSKSADAIGRRGGTESGSHD